MTTTEIDLATNINKYFDLAFNGEPVIVSRKDNQNVVIISEQEYDDLQKVANAVECLVEKYGKN